MKRNPNPNQNQTKAETKQVNRQQEQGPKSQIFSEDVGIPCARESWQNVTGNWGWVSWGRLPHPPRRLLCNGQTLGLGVLPVWDLRCPGGSSVPPPTLSGNAALHDALALFPLSHGECGNCNYLPQSLCSSNHSAVSWQIGSRHCAVKWTTGLGIPCRETGITYKDWRSS